MVRRILLFILLGFFVNPLLAQQRLKATVSSISTPSTNTGKFYYGNQNEPARAIEFKEKTILASAFLTNINHYFSIPSEFTFIEVESNSDHLGMHHRLLQQYYKGIPLEGLGYRVHEKNGFITAANGRAVRDIKLDTQTSISEEQAFYLAIQYLQTKDTVFRHGKKLIVSKNFTFTPESFSIAFQFDIDVSLIEQWRISIDARNGQILNKMSLVNTCFKHDEIKKEKEREKALPLPYGIGTGLTNYYGTRTVQIEKYDNGYSQLFGQTEHGGRIGTYSFGNASILAWIFGFDVRINSIYSADTTFNLRSHKPAVSAHWGVEQAYEYYFVKHGRNSYDNNGGFIKCIVHVDEDLDNAFWSRNTLLFGDGSNNNPLVELDVVSHELTHGVTQYEAGLQYYYEPGALNESFSDIFGKVIEFNTFGDTATWQLAKHFRDGGLRDMSNPNLKNQPDTYAGHLWYTGYEDNGGVHYNSGVQNFWFYLLCEGGSGVNDHQVSYSINSIGMEAAANIAYRNLTEYLSNSSDYLDSRIGSMLATADLYGKNSSVYQEVDKAWDAVGVIDEPIITSLEVFDITATTAKIKGSLLPRGDTVTYHFEYGTTPAFGSSSAIYKYNDSVEGILTGLQSQTKYYLRLVATNENGTTYFASEPFTTISLAPLVKSKQTVDVTETTATLYGKVNPNSLFTSFYFEYGQTPALGLVTPVYPLSDTTEFLEVSASVDNLQPRRTYYYRLVATNEYASATTESVNFFTAVKPVISSFTPHTATLGTEVTISGQNFNPVAELNLVSFGATRATVLSGTTTEIKVKVPVGASFGPIRLLDKESSLVAQSVNEFVPTFSGEFGKNSLQLKVGISDPIIWNALVEDIDGDGKSDIIGIHYMGFSIFQNVNQGEDITEESFVRNTYPVPDFYYSDLDAVDIDGNGLKDIIARSENGLRIFPNFSVPGFIFFGVPLDLPVENIWAIKFNDFDGDGRIDMAGIIPNSDSSILVIVRNQNPKGVLSANNFEVKYKHTCPYYIRNLNQGDLNNDGKIDLMAGTLDGDISFILENHSQPQNFDFEEVVVNDAARGRLVEYRAHDLNKDDRKDVISYSETQPGNMGILENQSEFQNLSLINSGVILNESTQHVFQPGDINGDEKVDLLVGVGNGKFLLLKNNLSIAEHISSSSFNKNGEFGNGNEDIYKQTSIILNDLNGDGRPEVINTHQFNRWPLTGYALEIWQNTSENCIDPSLIRLDVSKYSATIILPPNTTIDQFEIEYAQSDYDYWWKVYSPDLYLYPGNSYKFRARAKCYLGFTSYHYINFTTECVDVNSFTISNPGVSNVYLDAYDYGMFEVQYSLAGKNQWEILPQYVNQITDLMPGTTYDVRFRGRCNVPGDFKYKQFTTQCPKLSTLTISGLSYNRAVAIWTSNYIGDAIIEYSPNNTDWILADETYTMFPLIPGQKYYVRGRLACTNLNSDFIYDSFLTPCPEVTNLKVSSVTPFSAIVNWEDESNTGNYIIKYSIAAGGALTTLETSSTSVYLNDLQPGTEYKISVTPQCIGAKDFSTLVFRTVCYEPLDLLVSNIMYSTAELSWNSDFEGPPYFIDYSIKGSNVWQTKEATLTTVSLTELRPGTEYEVNVHINCLSITAPYASLFFETNLYEKTTYAPNPTSGSITIYPSKNLIGNRFSIQDNTGKTIAQGELQDYTLDLSAFSAGIYILKIEGENIMKIVKL